MSENPQKSLPKEMSSVAPRNEASAFTELNKNEPALNNMHKNREENAYENDTELECKVLQHPEPLGGFSGNFRRYARFGEHFMTKCTESFA